MYWAIPGISAILEQQTLSASALASLLKLKGSSLKMLSSQGRNMFQIQPALIRLRLSTTIIALSSCTSIFEQRPLYCRLTHRPISSQTLVWCLSFVWKAASQGCRLQSQRRVAPIEKTSQSEQLRAGLMLCLSRASLYQGDRQAVSLCSQEVRSPFLNPGKEPLQSSLMWPSPLMRMFLGLMSKCLVEEGSLSQSTQASSSTNSTYHTSGSLKKSAVSERLQISLSSEKGKLSKVQAAVTAIPQSPASWHL